MQTPIYYSSFEDDVHRPWVQRPSPPQPRVAVANAAAPRPSRMSRSYGDRHSMAEKARAESQRKMERALATSQRAQQRQQLALTAQQQAMAPFNNPRQRAFASSGGRFQPGPAGVGVRLIEPVSVAPGAYYAPAPARTPLVMSEPAVDGVTYDVVVNGPAVMDALPWINSGAPLAEFAAQVVMDAVADGIAHLAQLRGCFDPSLAAVGEQYADLSGPYFGEQSPFAVHPSLAARSYQLAPAGNRSPPGSYAAVAWSMPQSSTVYFANSDGSLGGGSFESLDAAKRCWSVPTPAFVSYVQSLLSDSLVAPEDVLLALHYIDRIPDSHKIFTSTSASEEFGAICTAPFKLFTGALMLANKTNQDNPYRNETWAQLTKSDKQITFKIEMDIVKALNYESSVRSKEAWRTWCGSMKVRARNLGVSTQTSTILDRLHRASLMDPYELGQTSHKIVYAARPGQDHSIVAGFRRSESDPDPTFDPLAYDALIVARGQVDTRQPNALVLSQSAPCFAPQPVWFGPSTEQQMAY